MSDTSPFRACAAAAPLVLAAAAPFLLDRWRPDLAAMLAVVPIALTLSAAVRFARLPAQPPGPVELAVHTLTLSVCAALTWLLGAALLGAASSGQVLHWAARLGTREALAVVLPPVGLLLAGGLWYGALREVLSGRRERRRQRSRSEIHGRAKLLERRHLRELARRRGILLGQDGRGPRAPLIGYALEGSAMTIAPPRTGKGATIALNMLHPDRRGHNGSTVTIDPRGELWCVVARRRRELGRRTILLDPSGVIAAHARAMGDELHLPRTVSDTYNPLDFIRDGEAEAMADINALLDALLTPPTDHGTTRHFYDSARGIVGGYMAWVRFREPPHLRTLARMHRLLQLPADAQKAFAEHAGAVAAADAYPCAGLTWTALNRESRAGKEEGGSNFSTLANQLSWLNGPRIREQTARSTFDPSALADGDTDLFVVVPEFEVDALKPWLRIWCCIPNAVSIRQPLRRDLLMIIDEMPRLGLIQPVMDAYNLAAGRGVHIWGFTQSMSALDKTWGKENAQILLDLAEVVQVLGCPRTDADGAERLSKAMGAATFESRSRSLSGSSSAGALFGGGQVQAGDSVQPTAGRLVTADDLLTLGEGEQYVIAAPKDMPRDPLHLGHARYWLRPDSRGLADPNPYVVRKEGARSDVR